MASTISAGTTTTTALVYSADTSGVLQLQTNGGTTAVTIDTAQNFGLGVTPSTWSTGHAMEFGAVGNALWGYSGNIVLSQNTAGYSGSFLYATTAAATRYQQNAGSHVWSNAPSGTAGNAITFTQAMTLDISGRLLLGTTTAPSDVASLAIGNIGAAGNPQQGVVITPSGIQVNGHASGTAGGTAYHYFNYAGGTIGSITQNGTTGVLYNLTSDYRLKNNQEDLTGAKDFIMALKPKKWQWWDGSGEGVGFIAHEFMEVAKYSGHGEKDAVDADGKPVYQSIQPSSSEVMANLVSFIQELSDQVTTLQTQVTALQSKG
jgi:hypothetical protein